MSGRIDGDLLVTGNIRIGGDLQPDLARSNLVQESLAEFPIPFEAWRVHDAFGTNLPGTPLTDDLGLVGGTFGTGTPSIQTEDLKAAGATTSYARAVVRLPAEYDAGEDVVLRFRAGMLTTIADTTATLDVEAYKLDDEAGVDGSDLVTTAAQTINSLTAADKDFVVSASGLSPGDLLDVRIAVAINDGASATAVVGLVGSASLRCDIRG